MQKKVYINYVFMVDMGMYVGVLNTLQVLGQLVAIFVATSVMTVATPLHIGEISTGLGTGGVWAVVAFPFISCLVVNHYESAKIYS